MPIYSTIISSSSTPIPGATIILSGDMYGVNPLGIVGATDAFSIGGVIFSGSNITLATSTDGVSQYIQMTGAAGVAIADSASTLANSTVVFSNANGVSFGLNGSTLTASISNYGNHSHGNVSLDLLNLSGTYSSASSGLTVSLTGAVQSAEPRVVSINGVSGSLTMNAGTFMSISQDLRSFTFNVIDTSAITSGAFPSANTTKFALAGFTTTATAGTEVVGTHNSLGLKLGVPAFITTAVGGGVAASISAGNVTSGGAGYSNITSGTLFLQGGNNITLSQDGANIVISGPNTVGAQTGISGISVSDTVFTAGSVYFSNSNGIVFGSNGANIVTASYTVPTIPGATVFSNSNNVTFGLNGSTVTASASFNQSAEPRVISFNGTSGSITLNAGSFLALSQNGVSFTMNVSDTSAITSAAFPSANTTKFAGPGTSSTTTSGVDLKFTQNSLGLSYAQPAYITTFAAQTLQPIGISGSNTSTTASTISFGASNSFDFYLTNGSIVGKFTESTHSHSAETFLGGIGNTASMFTTGSVILSGAANVTVNTSVGTGASTASQWLQISIADAIKELNATNGSIWGGSVALRGASNVTVSATGGTISFYGPANILNSFSVSGNVSTEGSSNITGGGFILAGGSNITLHQSNNTISIVGGGGTDGGPKGASASNGSFSFDTLSFGSSGITFHTNASGIQGSYTVPASGTLSFENSNGISWGSSSNGSTTTISASVETAYIPLANSTQYAGLSTGTQSTSGSVPTLTLNSSGLNLGIPAWLTTAVGGGSIYSGDFISLSINGISTSVSVTNTSSFTSNAINTSERANYFYTSNKTFAGTGTSLTTTGGTDFLYTLNTDGLSIKIPKFITTYAGVGGGDWSVATTNAGTDIIISTGAATNTLYHPAYITTAAPGGGGALSASNGSFTFNTGSFGSSIVTFFTNASGMQGSFTVPASGTLSFENTNGISWGSSSAGSTTTMTASVETAYIPLANSTKFGSGFTLSNFVHPEYGFADLGLIEQGSLSLKRVYIPHFITGTAFKIAVSISGSTNTSATTASCNLSFRYGIYSLNGSTLSLSTSGSAANGFQWSQRSDSSTGNTSINGMRQMTGSMNVSLHPGYYWVGALVTSATTYTNVGLTIYGGPNFEMNSGGMAIAPIGGDTTVSSFVIPFMGIYTAATASMPSSIGKAAIDWTSASNVARANFYNAIYANTY